MFDNYLNNLSVIEGAYRKLKSYYYYNKNFILMREKISIFENDNIDLSFRRIAEFLLDSKSQDSQNYITNLYSKISFFTLPKKFSISGNSNSNLTSNILNKSKKLESVNFFVDFPIELLIIDTIWTIYLGKIAYENNKINVNVYGNLLNTFELYDKREVDFKSNKMFHIYFKKYSNWRNKAFDSLESNYQIKRNSLLISMDIQAYYYNVRFNFDFHKYLGEHILISQISCLTEVMKEAYYIYFQKIIPLRMDLEGVNENAQPLPIGLFSSMLIGNFYLSEFDEKASLLTNCIYYGRYVDDILFCFTIDKLIDFSSNDLLIKIFKESNLFHFMDSSIIFAKSEYLKVQTDKVKLLYIDKDESRAILDLYNKKIRIIPSQVDILPSINVDFDDFEEFTYSIDNFNDDFKIRIIGNMNFDAFKVSRYFSSLSKKQVNINSFKKNYEISAQIKKILNYLDGNVVIENYSNLMNFFYFLVLSRQYKNSFLIFEKFMTTIDSLSCVESLSEIYVNKELIEENLHKTLRKHLEICLSSAYCLDYKTIKEEYKKNRNPIIEPIKNLSLCLLKSNMFDHSLISLSLSNYSMKTCDKLSRLDVSSYEFDLKNILKVNRKIRFTPRFIHFDEIQLAIFLNSINQPVESECNLELYDIQDIYMKCNRIQSDDMKVEIKKESLMNYSLESIKIISNEQHCFDKSELMVAIGNIKMSDEDLEVSMTNRWHMLTVQNKKVFRNLLEEALIESGENLKIIVLPELYLPIYWVKEIFDFSRKSQVAIVTGLNYIYDKKKKIIRNYTLSILPYTKGDFNYKSNYISIREKNDYSPIEIANIYDKGYKCFDQDIPKYQLYTWCDLYLSTIVCFEFTDIQARALLKGRCDFIALPVYNRDTTYFSNIIESTARDLHTFILQSNNSVYGDSRITGPYDRDSMNILQIKGGENNHIMIGKINYAKFLEFQENYDPYSQPKKSNSFKEKPEIKKPSARFTNSNNKFK